jgi:transcriptional regulator with XRE-family HTH domain
MPFNCELLRKIRREGSITRVGLANLLGITETYLYMLEKGKKEPSLKLIEKIVEILGVPVEKFLEEEAMADEVGIYDNVTALVDLRKKLESERHSRLKAEKHVLELERKNEHFEAIIGMHTRFEDILCQTSLTEEEKMEQLENLTKAVAVENELSVNEISTGLRIGRSIIKKWLYVEKQTYTCRFANGGKIIALNPGEASLRLRCFDCKDFESKKCKGHGDEKRPNNIIELIDRLIVNGVLNRIEQIHILDECYKIPLSLHEFSEVLYRGRHGQQIPEGIYYLDNTGRR